MAKTQSKPISFELSDDHRRAIEALAGGRKVRLSGRVEGGRVVVDFVACNSPFIACNAAFTACNAAFNACNAAFNK
jgi:hypothetical protein